MEEFNIGDICLLNYEGYVKNRKVIIISKRVIYKTETNNIYGCYWIKFENEEPFNFITDYSPHNCRNNKKEVLCCDYFLTKIIPKTIKPFGIVNFTNKYYK